MMTKLTTQNVQGTNYIVAGCSLTGVCATAAATFIKEVTLLDADIVADGMTVLCTFADSNSAGTAPKSRTIYSSDQVHYYTDSALTQAFTLAPEGCYTITYTGEGNAYIYVSFPVIRIGSVSAPLCDAAGNPTSGKLWRAGDTVALTYSERLGKFLMASNATGSGTIVELPNIQTGDTAQAKITLETLMNWLFSGGYIPQDEEANLCLTVPWSYASNDILRLNTNGVNYELQLAGVIIEFMGKATSYNNGRFRLRIHSSPTTSFTVTSGYTVFPVSHIAEYTCNGSTYSPVWKILMSLGDTASKADTTRINAYTANCDRPVMLGCGANTYEAIGKSGCCAFTFNPVSGVLKAKTFCGTATCATDATNATNAAKAAAVCTTLATANTARRLLLGEATYSASCNGAVYVSGCCQATFNPSNGTLSVTTLAATNVCGSSYARTPVVMSLGASGASKVCNVIIRTCCTNASCVLTCRNITFCGSTGYMHGNVCGNLCGLASRAGYAVCLYNRPGSVASAVCNVYFCTGCTNASCVACNFAACICGANGYYYGNICGNVCGLASRAGYAVCLYNRPGSAASKVCNVYFCVGCTNASCVACNFAACICGANGYYYGNVCGELCGSAKCAYNAECLDGLPASCYGTMWDICSCAAWNLCWGVNYTSCQWFIKALNTSCAIDSCNVLDVLSTYVIGVELQTLAGVPLYYAGCTFSYTTCWANTNARLFYENRQDMCITGYVIDAFNCIASTNLITSDYALSVSGAPFIMCGIKTW